MKQTNYGFSKIVNLGYEEAIEKVTEEKKKDNYNKVYRLINQIKKG